MTLRKAEEMSIAEGAAFMTARAIEVYEERCKTDPALKAMDVEAFSCGFILGVQDAWKSASTLARQKRPTTTEKPKINLKEGMERNRQEFLKWDAGDLVDYCCEANDLYWWLHEHMDDLPPTIAEEIADTIYRRIEP